MRNVLFVVEDIGSASLVALIRFVKRIYNGFDCEDIGP
jgi:hypothetical protein